MSISKLNVQDEVLTDAKMKKELKFKRAELRMIKIKDGKVSQFLNSQCSGMKQTAQFFHYMASEACTSVCSTLDIPLQNAWGGWFQSEFLVAYTRSLFETIDRIKQGQDRLVASSLLAMLDNERLIVKQCFQSAQERRLLESMKSHFDARAEQNRNAGINLDIMKASYIFMGNKCREKISQLTHNEEIMQLCEAKYQSSRDKIDRFKVNKAGCILNALEQKNLKAMNLDLAQDQASLQKFSEQTSNIRLSLQDLESQYRAKQLAIQAQEMLLLKTQQDREASAQAFNIAQESCIQNLISRVLSLQEGENYCHAAGFIGHAIYINFESVGNRIQAKICNLGAGRSHHPLTQSQPQLYLPVVVNFSKDKSGKENLTGFCQSIIKAITEAETEATCLLYQSGYGVEWTSEEYNQYYLEGKITAELQQTTGNGTAKGYFHALRERTKNDETYSNLIFSLFAYSKNLHFLRKQQTPNHHVLITSHDVMHLRQSEAVFKDKNEGWFRDKMNHLLLSAIAPRAIQQQAPKKVAGFTGGSARTGVDRLPSLSVL